MSWRAAWRPASEGVGTPTKKALIDLALATLEVDERGGFVEVCVGTIVLADGTKSTANAAGEAHDVSP
jgi:hypothetical protein